MRKQNVRKAEPLNLNTSGSSAGLDVRRRKLLFRSWHRGIREMDFLLGRFAEAQLSLLTDAELDEYETWLELPDQQMFAWLNSAQATPPDIDTPLFRRLRQFHLAHDPEKWGPVFGNDHTQTKC